VTPLCHIDTIAEGGARGFELAGASLFAVKRGGRIHLYHNRCPHRGIELNWLPDQFLDRDGTLIQCATHGALFLIDSGLCVAGPCHGRSLTALPFVIRDGWISVDLAPAQAT
jgi:nitrite reductase/ring-hydroxylating ferredoxin subunit